MAIIIDNNGYYDGNYRQVFRYDCVNGQCVPSETGKYPTLSACRLNCSGNPPMPSPPQPQPITPQPIAVGGSSSSTSTNSLMNTILKYKWYIIALIFIIIVIYFITKR